MEILFESVYVYLITDLNNKIDTIMNTKKDRVK
jgi:hypothetical protein